jgi:hypothetical protein
VPWQPLREPAIERGIGIARERSVELLRIEVTNEVGEKPVAAADGVVLRVEENPQPLTHSYRSLVNVSRR